MIYIINVIILILCVIFQTYLLISWLKAEKKLAKHGESTLYKTAEKKCKKK